VLSVVFGESGSLFLSVNMFIRQRQTVQAKNSNKNNKISQSLQSFTHFLNLSLRLCISGRKRIIIKVIIN